MTRTMFVDGKCCKLATRAGRCLQFTAFAPKVQAAIDAFKLIKEFKSLFESGVYIAALEEEKEEEEVVSESYLHKN